MSKSAQIRARTEPEVKEAAEAVLERLGLTPSAAINLFYHQVIHRQAIPFEVALPNAETRVAIEEAREGAGLTAGSAEELFAALDEE